MRIERLVAAAELSDRIKTQRSLRSFSRPEFIKKTAFLQPVNIAPVDEVLRPDFFCPRVDSCGLIEDSLKSFRLKFQPWLHDLDFLFVRGVEDFSIADAQLLAQDFVGQFL